MKISLWVFGVLLLVIALPGYPPLAIGLFFLVVGWISYLGGVLPRITVSWEGVALISVCMGLAAALGHGFCQWLWRGIGKETAWRPRWTLAGLAAIILMFAAGTAFTGVIHQTGWLVRSPEPLTRSEGSERNALSSLKTFASAQADYRANNRGGSGKQDFWRRDIAGLYALTPAGSNEPIKLIDLSLALADDRPVTDIGKFGTRSPKAGYLYRAIPLKGEVTSSPDHFAACSFPVNSSAGKWIFIISEVNILYRKPFTGSPPEFYPDDPVKDGWTKLD